MWVHLPDSTPFLCEVVRQNLRHACDVRSPRLGRGLHGLLVRLDRRVSEGGITGRRGLLAHGLGGVERVCRGGQMVRQRAEEEAREEPFVGESLGPRGEVVLQDGGIFLRHGGYGTAPTEILRRVTVLAGGARR